MHPKESHVLCDGFSLFMWALRLPFPYTPEHGSLCSSGLVVSNGGKLPTIWKAEVKQINIVLGRSWTLDPETSADTGVYKLLCDKGSSSSELSPISVLAFVEGISELPGCSPYPVSLLYFGSRSTPVCQTMEVNYQDLQKHLL